MIQNFASFNYSELYVIFGGKNLINILESISTTDVVIDSRKAQTGSIFVALVGEHIDGHSKVSNAFENGAAICIVNQQWYDSNYQNYPNQSFIVVKDTLKSLGDLANFHRNRFSLSIIAVTGANGKTSTKEMIASVLSEKYKVLKTFENYNNMIGLPLMLLSLDNSYEVAVLELGTNHPGEIYELGKISKPDHALVTNIGKEHLEFLIDLDGVELEETSIFGEVRAGGVAYVNYDDVRLKKYGHILDKFITYGTDKEANLVAEIELDEYLKPKISIKYENHNVVLELNTFGLASARNAIAAAAVAFNFDLNIEQIKYGLEKFQPLLSHNYGRMALEQFNNLIIINDCYNANPSSMEIALENIQNIKDTRQKIAILGDMKELGDSSLEEHKNIIEFASKSSDIVCIIGEEMNNAFEMFEFDSNIMLFDTKEDIVNFVNTIADNGLIILVKGSRSMKMEDIIEQLRSTEAKLI